VLLRAVLVKEVVEPDFPGQIAGPLLLLPVVFSAWFGGRVPGLLTAVVSYLALDYFFLPPVYSLDPGWEDIPIGGIYLLTALAVSVLQERRRRAEEAVGRFKERMLLAKSIQVHLLPQAPPSIPGFDIVGTCQPAEETGGDFFDFIPMRGGKLCVVVGDVSGHGFPSALLMAETLACLRALALGHDDLSEILTLTNAMLLRSPVDDYFVTAFIACIDPKDRSLAYAGAGHGALLLHPTARLRRLRSTGPPLGVVEAVIPQTRSGLALEYGDVRALVTDGIIESRSQGGEQFGIGRAIEVITARRTLSAREMAESRVGSARVFSRRRRQEDGMTAVIVKVGGQETGCDAELLKLDGETSGSSASHTGPPGRLGQPGGRRAGPGRPGPDHRSGNA
jgi:serine phosphatase RsbU (regulator of sigma subunit)